MTGSIALRSAIVEGLLSLKCPETVPSVDSCSDGLRDGVRELFDMSSKVLAVFLQIEL